MLIELVITTRNVSDAVNLFVGRPFQAVVAAKKGQFRRPEKGVLRFLTASAV
jgi:hypothetical protein